MNQSQLFKRWVTGRVTELTVVGSVYARPHRLFYGPLGPSLALRRGDMVMVSSLTKTKSLQTSIISGHRIKLYQVCEDAGIKFSRAVPGGDFDCVRPGKPGSFRTVRNVMESIEDGHTTPDFFPVHEVFGHLMSVRREARFMARYSFACRMLGTEPLLTTATGMADWHQGITLLSSEPFPESGKAKCP